MRAETPLLDEVVVAEEPARLPRDVVAQGREQLVGACQPAASDVDPRRVVQRYALEVGLGVDVGVARTTRFSRRQIVAYLTKAARPTIGADSGCAARLPRTALFGEVEDRRRRLPTMR